MSTATVASLLRAEQAYHAQLAETTSLDWGIAFVSQSYPGHPDANQFREVILEADTDASEAFNAVTSFYENRDRRCHKWVVAADSENADLATLLTEQAFTSRSVHALLLSEWIDLTVPDDVRILPARAMRKAVSAIHEERFDVPDTDHQAMLCDAARERLNDARMDAFVALAGGQPAGCCTLFEIGDIGRVSDLYVMQNHRRRGIGTALTGQVLRLARRLLLRVVCAPVPADNQAALAMFARCGMHPDGSLAEYVAPGVQLIDG